MKKPFNEVYEQAVGDKHKEDIISAIAFNELRIRSLIPANHDDTDFHQCHVASIKAALEQAYEAGQNSVA